MKRNATILFVLALAGGIAGLLLRRLCLQTAFEPVSGLPIPGQPATLALWGLLAALVLAAALLSRGERPALEGRYSTAFRPYGALSLILRLGGGALLALGGFLNIYAWLSSPVSGSGQRSASLLRLILGLLCLFAGAAVLLALKKLREGGQLRGVLPLAPGFACCLWVMANYQNWAKDPVLGNYVFSMLALLLSMAACYLHASFAFGKARVWLTLTVSAVAAALNLLVLADATALEDTCLHLALAFYLLSMLLPLASVRPDPAAPACGGPACESCPGCPPGTEP